MSVSSVYACQRENKFGPDPFGADDVDMFIMCLDRFFDDREPESGAFFIFAAGKVGFVKSFPDLVEFFFRNPDPVVFDRYKDLVIAAGHFHSDGRIMLTEFDRIVQKVIENLMDLSRVGEDEHILRK